MRRTVKELKQSSRGTRGQRDPEETSQSKEYSPTETETRLRDSEELILETENMSSEGWRNGGNRRRTELGGRAQVEAWWWKAEKPERML